MYNPLVTTEKSIPAPIDLARKLLEVIEDRQGIDVMLLDLRPAMAFTDFFVICSGETKRHLDALTEEAEQAMKQAGASLHHREGSSDGGWVLLDYIDVVAHVFSTEERDRYRLERVWSTAVPLVRIL